MGLLLSAVFRRSRRALCGADSQTGLRPVEYLTRLRLEEAVRLLNTTSLPIDTISSRCGFGDGNYFSKVFRSHMSLSPRAFRQQLQSQQYRSIQL